MSGRDVTVNGNFTLKSFRWTGLLFLIYFLLTSCVERKEERGLCDGKNLNELKSEIDIFRQKVKEDNYALDPLRLKFNEILLEKKSEGTYMLQVHCDLGSTNTNEINNYYFILSIYPYDNDIKMLNKDRIKFGFEMFSMNIRYSQDKEKLIIGREIKTTIKKARAITLTLMEYKSKSKIREIVMLNVKLK